MDCRRCLDEVFSLARLDKLFLLVMVLRAHPGIGAAGGEKSRISTIILARSDGIRAFVADLDTLRLVHGGAFGVLCLGMRPWIEQQLVPERIRVSNPKHPRKQADALRSNTQLPANVLSVLYE